MESFAGYRLILNMHYLDKPEFTGALDVNSTGVQLTTNIEVERTTGDVATFANPRRPRREWHYESSRTRSAFARGRVTFADEEAIVGVEEEYEMTPTATSSGTGSQPRAPMPAFTSASHV